MRIYLFLLLVLLGCHSETGIKNTLENSKASNDDIIEACQYICNHKSSFDSTIVISLLTNIFDERISSSFAHYGKVPYVERLKALSIVTGINAGLSFNSDTIDALLVDCYIKYAIQKRIIPKTSCIRFVHPYIESFYNDTDYFLSIKNAEVVNWKNDYHWKRRQTSGILHN